MKPRFHHGLLLLLIFVLVVLTTTGCSKNRNTPRPNARPQEPAGPVPYRTDEVRFQNTQDGVSLAGTLSLPRGDGPHPAAILITGSGPQDRDETVAGHKPFLVLADYLTRHGIAVLRYDDRGVAESTGDFETATMREFARDAQAAVAFLQSHRHIDADRIGLIGHSEGGMVAPMAAEQLPEQVAYLVLLASPGITGEQIFYLQDAVQARASGVDEQTIARNQRRKQQIFEILKEEPDLGRAAERLRQTMRSMPISEEEKQQIAASGIDLDDLIDQQIRLLNNAATRFFLAYDPIPTLSRTTVPVLAVIGGNDLQVPPDENLPPVRDALEAGPCPAYSVHELAGLNHLFQTSETGRPEEYARIEQTFAPAALQLIGEWIAETTTARR